MNPEAVTAVPGAAGAPYSSVRYQHLFGAWAAGRAASVKGCRFKVSVGRAILEAVGFTPNFSQPEQLPAPAELDRLHRDWRTAAVAGATRKGLTFTHGVAANLINVYLKCRFAGHYGNERVAALHPPIDDELLKALINRNVGGLTKDWRRVRRWRWSKFTSEQYECVIALIRQSLKDGPLWSIEEY